MKKYFRLLLIPLLLTALNSCEEDEAPIRFSFSNESITNADNVRIDYYSPDPSCLAKMYHINTNRFDGEITIKCTNASAVYFNNTKDYPQDLAQIDATHWVCERAKWSATFIDATTIKFVFDELPTDARFENGYEVYFGYFPLKATINGKEVTDAIQITRYVIENSLADYNY